MCGWDFSGFHRVVFLCFAFQATVTVAPGNIRERCSKYVDEFDTVLIEDVCYVVHHDKVTWNRAKGNCEILDGQLVKIPTKELNNLLETARFIGPLENPKSQIWIGAKQKRDGKFEWTDGTPMLYDGRDSFSKKTGGWFFSSNTQSCLTNNIYPAQLGFLPMTGWQTEDCDKEFTYMCEHKAESVSLKGKHSTVLIDTSRFTIVPERHEGVTERTSSAHSSNLETTTVKESPVTALSILAKTPGPTPLSEKQPSSTGSLTNGVLPRITTVKKSPVTGAPASPPIKKRNSQQLYKGMKSVGDVFNPKIRATPDVTQNFKTVVECLQYCHHVRGCGLINFYRTGVCKMYDDQQRAIGSGADSVPGWMLWIYIGEQ